LRARGEVRQALAMAVAELAALKGPVSSREAAAHVQVGFDLARRTLDNMARAGEVVVAGYGKAPGARWHNLYEPAVDADVTKPWGGIEDLDAAVRRMAAAAPAAQRSDELEAAASE
jgi:hypothetical protein